jgi:hypothetical protein
MPTSSPSLIQLRQAIEIHEQIQKLEAELQAIFSGGESSGGKSAPAAADEAPKTRGRKKGSKGKKAKRVLSPEGRAAIVAALKARHAAKKKGK